MTYEMGVRCAQAAGLAITFLLGLFSMMIFLSMLAVTPADAAVVSGYASCPSLHYKSRGPCVTELQRQLDEDGISPRLRADGVFGAQTVVAVKNYQRKMKLPADGVVGPTTFRALEQRAKAARTPASGTSRPSRILHAIKNFGISLWRHTGPQVIAICVIIMAMFAAAAVFGVRSVRIRCSGRKVECDIERFAPQRIVDTQAAVINRYLDVYSTNPGQLPPPDHHIRSIGSGG